MEKNNTKKTNWFRYALGMLGYSIPGYLYLSYGTYFYTEEIGLRLDLIAVGTILFVIWDAINDPLMGYLSDKTRTKMGRRKPWLLIGAPLFALSVNLFFNPIVTDNMGMLLIFYTLVLMLTETFNTILTTNYHALLPELFSNVTERTRANAARQMLSLIGMIGGFVLPPILISKFGYQNVALMLSIIGLVIFLYSALGVHEDPKAQETEPPKLKDSLKTIVSNRNFWTVGLANFFYQGANGLLLTVIPYFVTYTLGLSASNATYLTAAVFVTAIPSVYVWSMVARKIGVIKTWRFALMWLMISFIPMFFVNGLISAIIFAVIIGVGIGGVIANIDLINAEIIDEDYRKSGLRREGIYQSSINFMVKFSGLLRSVVFFLVTILFGFYSAENPGSNPATAARFMFSVFPFFLLLLATIMSFFVSNSLEKKK